MITLWVRFGIMANIVKAFDSQFSIASSLVNHSLSPARQVEYQEPIDVAIKTFSYASLTKNHPCLELTITL